MSNSVHYFYFDYFYLVCFVWIFFISIVSLVIGSFLNVVITRLPNLILKTINTSANTAVNTTTNTAVKIATKPMSKPTTNTTVLKILSFPRSHCPQCQHPIAIYDLIPIFSYFCLKAKCRYCKSSISFRYPLVEILTLFLSILIVLRFGFNFQTIEHFSSLVNFSSLENIPVLEKILALEIYEPFRIFRTLGALFFLWALIAVAFIDIEHFLIPNSITFPFILLGLSCNYFEMFQSFENAVFGSIIGYGFLWSILHLYKFLTNKQGLGFGDLKLLAMIGAWLGWQVLPFIMLISTILGSSWGILLILLGRANRNTPLPFGTFLAIAAVVTLFFMPLI